MEPDPPSTQLYRDTIPSVVSVYLAVTTTGGRPVSGAGSGFVYDEFGYVVTNAHVVGDEREVELRFADGEWRTGEVVGVDAYTDLAVVFVADLPETAVPLAVARTTPEPGEPVAAFGNPMGLDGTMTTGVVSGTSRSTAGERGFAIPDTIQTDAAINPGSSGGPLVRAADGRVVGVNRARVGDNIGFAISPANLHRVLPALVDRGGYRHAYLNVRTVDVSPTVAEANGLDGPGGVLVVDAGRPAGAEGLRGCRATRRVRGRSVPVGGDVIVGVDSRPVDSHESLVHYLVTECSPGDVLAVDVVRDGQEDRVSVRLEARPTPGGSERRPPRTTAGA